MVKFDWNNIKKSTELILKENTTIKIKFLNNEVDVKTWMDSNQKEKDKFLFKVLEINSNKEKDFSVLSNPLMVELKKYNPLKDKEFTIRKYRIGATDFDIEYEVIHLNPKP